MATLCIAVNNNGGVAMVTGYIRSACEHFIVNYTDDVQQTFNLKNTAEKDLVNHNSHHW